MIFITLNKACRRGDEKTYLEWYEKWRDNFWGYFRNKVKWRFLIIFLTGMLVVSIQYRSLNFMHLAFDLKSLLSVFVPILVAFGSGYYNWRHTGFNYYLLTLKNSGIPKLPTDHVCAVYGAKRVEDTVEWVAKWANKKYYFSFIFSILFPLIFLLVFYFIECFTAHKIVSPSATIYQLGINISFILIAIFSVAGFFYGISYNAEKIRLYQKIISLKK